MDNYYILSLILFQPKQLLQEVAVQQSVPEGRIVWQ
jgi:hypothetical protein